MKTPALTFNFFNNHSCFCDQCCDRTDRSELRGDQYADYTKCKRNLKDDFAFFVLDDDAADVALFEQILDLGDQFFAIDAKFFSAKFFFRHGSLQL